LSRSWLRPQSTSGESHIYAPANNPQDHRAPAPTFREPVDSFRENAVFPSVSASTSLVPQPARLVHGLLQPSIGNANTARIDFSLNNRQSVTPAIPRKEDPTLRPENPTSFRDAPTVSRASTTLANIAQQHEILETQLAIKVLTFAF
jgi:hypothetical protein